MWKDFPFINVEYPLYCFNVKIAKKEVVFEENVLSEIVHGNTFKTKLSRKLMHFHYDLTVHKFALHLKLTKLVSSFN